MTKQKMPTGWVRVTWKDNNGKKWSSNVPISAYGRIQLEIIAKGGVIIKEEF